MTTPQTFPLISIIMPCFNAERHLKQSIGSILEQTYPQWELIVINDGSTDDSLSLLNSFNDERITVLDQPNNGVCKTRNRGILAAKGELIAFLDADDTWHPECLSSLYQALSDDHTAALAYCGWQNIGLPGGAGKPFLPPNYETKNKLAVLFRNCAWPIHACLTSKKLILEAGLFDESLVTSEDFLLWLQIASTNKLTRVPKVLAYYHFHDGYQATRNKQRLALNHFRAQQKFLKQNPQIVSILGKNKIRELMLGELLKKGFECYWKRDLSAARSIFRKVMRHGFGTPKEWLYMIPSLLPFNVHHTLILIFNRFRI